MELEFGGDTNRAGGFLDMIVKVEPAAYGTSSFQWNMKSSQTTLYSCPGCSHLLVRRLGRSCDVVLVALCGMIEAGVAWC